MNNDIYEAPEADLKEQPAAAQPPAAENSADAELKGLGGWLILVGLGVVVGPFRMLVQIVQIYMPIFSDGTFSVLTDPGSEYYIPYIGTFIISELFFNSVLILASFYLIYLFFSKHYLFPRAYILIVFCSFTFIVVDAWVGSLFFPGDGVFDQETLGELARVSIGVVIWVPYMLVSKRVKATFVEHKPD